MWWNPIGSVFRNPTAPDHNAWEGEQAKKHIFPHQRGDVWPSPDILPPPPPPMIVSLKKEQVHFECSPHPIMAANGLQSFDLSGMGTDHDDEHAPIPHQTDYQAAVRLSSDASYEE